MYGPLIVRQPDSDNFHKHLYDEDLSEHVLMIQDWVHKSGVPMWYKHHWDDGSNKATSFLVNGRGRSRNFGVNSHPGLFTPVEELFVKPNTRYRLRIIDVGVSLCPVEMSIEGHNMTLIASDGADIKPIEINSLVLHNGERYDVVINTTGMKSKSYLIKFGGLMDCSANSIHGSALLTYTTESKRTDQNEVFKGPTNYKNYINTPGVQVNSINRGQGDKQRISVADLRSVMWEQVPQANRTIYLAYNFHDADHPDFYDKHYTFQDVIGKNNLRTPKMNNITLALPISPLLTQIEVMTTNRVVKIVYCPKALFL